MGTDIHVVVQRREGPLWVNVDMGWNGLSRREHPLTWRDYNAFAILANVRNGHGFAGIYTSDGFQPISDERGLPDDFPPFDDNYHVRCARHAGVPVDTDDEDAADELWDCDDCVWMGDHSHTWVLAQELVDYDWDAPVRVRMVLDYETYKRWAIDGQKVGFPPSWCGAVSGPRIVTVTEEAAPLAPGLIQEGKEVYVAAFASYPRKEAARGLYDKVLPWLQTLGDPKDVRIVMGFDS